MADVDYATSLQDFFSLSPDEMAWSEAGWIMLNTHLGPEGKNTILEDWQVYFLNNPHPRQVWAKSRQVGFSWASSAKALARSYLEPLRGRRGYTAVFVSISREEAMNKIRYAMELWDTLPSELRGGPLRLTSESKMVLEFANGARILSYPAKAVRGIAAADIFLDEFAHVPRAEEIFRGTTAATIRAKEAALVVGSTPFGQVGPFYELVHREDGAFAKNFVYWWDSLALCKEPIEARRAAVEEAWHLNRSRQAVEGRVYRWGTPELIREYQTLPLEAFLQEYEVAFGAVTDAAIPYDLIVAAVDPELAVPTLGFSPLPEGRVEEVVGKLVEAISSTPGHVWAGYDVARKRDQAALVLVAHGKDGRVTLVGRLVMRDTPFHVQEAVLHGVLKHPKLVSLAVDITGGMGAPLQEKLAMTWGESRVLGVNFSPTEKHQLASRLQALFSRGTISIPGDRELMTQVASVRKTVSSSGRLRYEGGGDGHHADLFWALALAVRGTPLELPQVGVEVAASSVARVMRAELPGDSFRDEWRGFLRSRRRGEV